MALCEEVTGLPCIDDGDLDLPDGEAVIVGVLEAGSVIDYIDPEGIAFKHTFTDPHQLVAIGDGEGNTALLIISDRLEYGPRGIVG